MLKYLTIFFVLLAAPALAQTAVPTSSLQWDPPNATAVDAQTYTYKYYPDGAAVGIVLSGVLCVGTPVVTCTAPFPSFTPGSHTLTLTANNVAGESPQSAPPLSFAFVVVPSAPSGVRIR